MLPLNHSLRLFFGERTREAVFKKEEFYKKDAKNTGYLLYRGLIN